MKSTDDEVIDLSQDIIKHLGKLFEGRPRVYCYTAFLLAFISLSRALGLKDKDALMLLEHHLKETQEENG